MVSRTSGTNLVSFVHACLDLLIVLAQVRSWLKLDQTLGAIPSD
jgi:hypothetical protein